MEQRELTMKAYTDIEQSKKLAEILPLDSADMWWNFYSVTTDSTTPQIIHLDTPWVGNFNWNNKSDNVPCWSLYALLDYIKDKCDYFELVYLSSTIDGRANRLENVYRLSTDMYDVYEKEAVDACVEMILKLYELKLL